MMFFYLLTILSECTGDGFNIFFYILILSVLSETSKTHHQYLTFGLFEETAHLNLNIKSAWKKEWLTAFRRLWKGFCLQNGRMIWLPCLPHFDGITDQRFFKGGQIRFRSSSYWVIRFEYNLLLPSIESSCCSHVKEIFQPFTQQVNAPLKEI